MDELTAEQADVVASEAATIGGAILTLGGGDSAMALTLLSSVAAIVFRTVFQGQESHLVDYIDNFPSIVKEGVAALQRGEADVVGKSMQ